MHITDWWNTCGCWNIKRAEHKGRKELHLWEQVCSLGKKLGHEGMLRAISLLLGGVLGCLLIIRLFSPLMLVKPLLLSLLLMLVSTFAGFRSGSLSALGSNTDSNSAR